MSLPPPVPRRLASWTVSTLEQTRDDVPSSARLESAVGSWARRGYAVALVLTLSTTLLVPGGTRGVLAVVPGLVLAVVVLLTRREGESSPRPLVLASLLSGLAYGWAAWTGATFAAGVGAGVCAGLWVVRSAHRRRPAVSAGLLVVLVAVGALGLGRDADDAGRAVLLLAGMACVWMATVVDGEGQRHLFDALRRATDMERELSVLRERYRFAADLHDVQGHSLHVIRLKAAVAERLQEADPARAAEELAAIRVLAGEAIEQARSLADATHPLSLAAELANAEQLLRAAGIATTTGPAPAPGPHDEALALVLREATTNLLRHARPTRVDVVVDATSLRVENDGAPPDRGPLRGLATLRQRVAQAGGRLEIEQAQGAFCVRATFDGRGQAWP